MAGPLVSPYAPGPNRMNDAFRIADLIRRQGYASAETKGQTLATVSDLVLGGADMVFGSMARRDEKRRVQAENEKLADLISSGQPVDLGALIRQVGPARAKEIYGLLQLAKPKADEPYTLNPGDVRFGANNQQVASVPVKAEPPKPLALIDREAQGIYDPNVMGYIPGTSYTDPVKAPVQSSQGEEFLLDGKTKVKGDYVPGVGGKPGTYWYNGQDVTGRAAPLPDKPTGGDRGPTAFQEYGMAERLAAAWAKANGPTKEMDRQLRIMRVGRQAFDRGDKVGGAQTIINTFGKILDPTSVVREAEYARTAAGQSWLDRLQGFYDTAKSGGANVDPAVLKGLVDTAEGFFASMQEVNAGTRRRISAQAEKYQLRPDTIFDDLIAGDPTHQPSQSGGQYRVTAPDGSVHNFVTKAEADAFRQLMGGP